MSAPPERAGSSRARGLRLALTIAATLVIVALLVKKLAGTQKFVQVLGQAVPSGIAFAFGLACLGVALAGARFKLVLAAMGYDVRFFRVLRVIVAAWPVAVVTPARAGDLVRPVMLQTEVPLAPGVASVVAERAIDVFSLLLAGLLGCLAYRMWVESGFISGLLIAECAVIFAVLRSRAALMRLRFVRARAEQVDQLYAGLAALTTHRGRLVSIVALSIAIRLLTVGMVDLLLGSFGVGIAFFRIVGPLMIATLAGLLPVTLAGMGTRDAAFVLLMQAHAGVRLPEAALLAASLSYSLIAIWSFAVIGVPFLLAATLRRASG